MPYKKEWVEPELLAQIAGEYESVVNVYAAYEDEDIEKVEPLTASYVQVDKHGEVINEGTVEATCPEQDNMQSIRDVQSYLIGYIQCLVDSGTLEENSKAIHVSNYI